MLGMTSKLNQRDDSHGGSASKPIHFFRIMLSHNLLHGKLVRKYDSFLEIIHCIHLKYN